MSQSEFDQARARKVQIIWCLIFAAVAGGFVLAAKHIDTSQAQIEQIEASLPKGPPPWEQEAAWRHVLHVGERYKQIPAEVASFVNGGASLAKAGKMEEAAEEFRKALDIVPGYPTALQNLVLTLAELGQPAEIQERYDAWIQPNTSEGKEAAEIRKEGLSGKFLDDEELLILRALSRAYEKVGKFKDAFDALRPMSDRFPEDRALTRNLALLAAKANLTNEAFVLAEKALKQYWRQPDLIDIVKRIGENEPVYKQRAERTASFFELREKAFKGKLKPGDLGPQPPSRMSSPARPTVPGLPGRPQPQPGRPPSGLRPGQIPGTPAIPRPGPGNPSGVGR